MQQLGRTGIEVSAYCLGTMVFGRMGNPDHDDCVGMIHRALDGGIHFIDTADVYGYSETEEIVGNALKGRRDEIVPATKFNGPMGEGPNRRGSSRRWIVTAVEDSLQTVRAGRARAFRSRAASTQRSSWPPPPRHESIRHLRLPRELRRSRPGAPRLGTHRVPT